MNNDTISRSALRKDIEHLYSVYAENKDWFYTAVLNHIDNATPVELVNDSQRLVKELVKGEWIWLGDNPSPNHKYSCNKCGRGVKEQENFCPSCGVKMKKGGAE